MTLLDLGDREDFAGLGARNDLGLGRLGGRRRGER